MRTFEELRGPEDTWCTSLASIQLTQAWSPVPAAVDILGEPGHEALTDLASELTERRTLAVGWQLPTDVKSIARRLRGRRASHDDEKRFHELLAAVVFRAAQRPGDVLLIARPGWSYEHSPPVSRETASLMKKAGFVVTSRTISDGPPA